MNKLTSSKEMLEDPFVGDHYVQLYQETTELSEAVYHFITDNLSTSEAIIIVATPSHTKTFTDLLTYKGYDLSELIEKGQLTLLDAEDLLHSFLKKGMPDAELFLNTIGPIFRKVFRDYTSARVYGEMVNILWQDGEEKAAIALEILWNALLRDYKFSLLCAYEIDNLNHANYTEAFNCVCNTHTHLIPPQNPHHFEKAILDASIELPVDVVEMIYSTSKLGHPTTLMPPAQASLFHLSKTMPNELEQVLTQVRFDLNSKIQ
ncbi:MAG: MEDS domain-containing protein [Methylotenera sp.]|nr:MEDS domain-containing protein [Methylotenera sp.]